MCFYIHNDHKEVKIATETITCYKRVKKAGSINFGDNKSYFKKKGWCLNTLLSVYQYMPYRVKTLYEVNVRFPKNKFTISKGLHSYSTLKHTKWARDSFEIILECKIPKGAKYFYNPERNEYVSNQLRTVRIVY